MKVKTIFSIMLISLAFVACKSDPLKDMKKTELMEYGFPIAMYVPEDAVIKKTDFGVMQDLTVKAGDHYYVQIFSSDANTLDDQKMLNDKLAEVKSQPYFSKIISEEENGFIFEKNVDSTLNYDFRYFKIQGDKEYVFQTGLVGNFTEDDVKVMYDSVK